MDVILGECTPWSQDANWTYIKRSEEHLNIWTSYLHSIYVLCPGRWTFEDWSFNQTQTFSKFSVSLELLILFSYIFKFLFINLFLSHRQSNCTKFYYSSKLYRKIRTWFFFLKKITFARSLFRFKLETAELGV